MLSVPHSHTAFPLERIGVPRLSPPERGVPRPLIDTALINGLPQVSPCHIRARGRIARSAELPKGRPPRRRLDRSVQAWIFAFPVALSQRLNSSAALPTPSDARSCLIGPGADKRPVAGRAGSQVAAIRKEDRYPRVSHDVMRHTPQDGLADAIMGI